MTHRVAGSSFEWGRDEHPAKPDYDLFAPAFNFCRRWHCPWDDVLFFLNAAYLLCRHEYTRLKRAAVSGQCHLGSTSVSIGSLH